MEFLSTFHLNDFFNNLYYLIDIFYILWLVKFIEYSILLPIQKIVGCV